MEKKITTIAIIYFIIGLFFAIAFDFFYHWGVRALFSPGFYVVALTWPLQLPGFIADFQYYGLTGKVLY